MQEIFDSGSKEEIFCCSGKQVELSVPEFRTSHLKCTYIQGKTCGIKNCVRYRHPRLRINPKTSVLYEDRDSDCSDLPDLNEINFEEFKSNSDSEVETFHVDVYQVARDGAVGLQTLVCDVKAGCKSQRIIVLLDSGSNSTLID